MNGETETLIAPVAEGDLPPAVAGTKAEKRPAGWWSVPGHDFDGSREGVLTEIKKRLDIPACWRNAMIERVNGADAKFNHVTIDAHVCMGDVPGGKKATETYDFNFTWSVKL